MGCKANAVHKPVKGRPSGSQVCKQFGYLGIITHVAIEYQFGVEIGRKFGDAFLEALSNVAEGQLGTLRVAGLGDAIRNGAIGQYTRNQQFFT